MTVRLKIRLNIVIGSLGIMIILWESAILERITYIWELVKFDKSNEACITYWYK